MSLYAQDPDYIYALPPQATVDAFRTFLCPRSSRLTITVANQAIFYQIGRGTPNPQFAGGEIHAVPGVWIRNIEADAIRYRSASTGNPAVISIEAR